MRGGKEENKSMYIDIFMVKAGAEKVLILFQIFKHYRELYRERGGGGVGIEELTGL